MKFLRALLLAALPLLLPFAAAAQSSLPSACTPVITYRAVPTPLQWQACLTAINNNVSGGGGGAGNLTGAQVIAALTYVPVNKAGDGMGGKLTMVSPNTVQASVNFPPGTAPSAPVNGDMWSTSTSLFFRLNGTTKDLLAQISSATGDCTGTASGTSIPLTCAPLAHLAANNNFTAQNLFSGGVAVNYQTLNSSSTLTPSMDAICGDVSGGAITLTMPPGTGASIQNGQVIPIKDCKRAAGTNHLTIAANAGQTIEGVGSVVLTINGQSINPVWNSATNDWDLF